MISYPAGSDEDAIMEAALEAGAEDVVVDDDGSLHVLTTPDQFPATQKAMADAGFEPELAEVTMRAETTTTLDLKGAQKMVRLLPMLEELDDVQNVYSNAEIANEILQQL